MYSYDHQLLDRLTSSLTGSASDSSFKANRVALELGESCSHDQRKDQLQVGICRRRGLRTQARRFPGFHPAKLRHSASGSALWPR